MTLVWGNRDSGGKVITEPSSEIPLEVKIFIVCCDVTKHPLYSHSN